MDSIETALGIKIGQVEAEFALDLNLPQLVNHIFSVQWAVICSLALEVLPGFLSLNQRHIQVSCLDHSVEVLEISLVVPGSIFAHFDVLRYRLPCLATVGKLNN